MNKKISVRPPEHTAVLKIKGRIYVPPHTQSDPRFIVPDDVVQDMATQYNLDKPGTKGVDPMVGVGTIPRVIAGMGGYCEAMEVDEQQHEVARSVIPSHVPVRLGGCLDFEPDDPYDYVYTSIPFRWFKNFPKVTNSRLAEVFRRMIRPDGLLIIDSDDLVVREDATWPLAASQVAYFTQNGFTFFESRRYVCDHSRDYGDMAFTELVFKRS